MFKTTLGLFGAGAIALLAVSYSQVSAQTPPPAAPKAPAAAACRTVTDEAGCGARDDCSWVAAVMDKSGKEKRKAYCRRKAGGGKKKT